MKMDSDVIRNQWQHLVNKFLQPSIKHNQVFTNFGCHLILYLYFCNLSRQKGNFVPTKKFPFSVVDKDGAPRTQFKRNCDQELNILLDHYIQIMKNGGVFTFKRSMKQNNPNLNFPHTNKHYSKLWKQLNIHKIKALLIHILIY